MGASMFVLGIACCNTKVYLIYAWLIIFKNVNGVMRK
jgi:hypothetical protein